MTSDGAEQTDGGSAVQTGDSSGRQDETPDTADRVDLRRGLLDAVESYFTAVDEETPEGGAVLSELQPEQRAAQTGGLFSRLRGVLGRGRSADVIEELPSSEFIEDRWFDLSVIEGYRVEEHYWVKRPFAHVTILYDPAERRRRYHVTEPELNEFERELREVLVQVLRSELMYADIETEKDRIGVFVDQLREVVNEYAATAAPGTVHKMLYYLVRDFLDYGKIDPLMQDSRIEDISCDGENVPVYVFHEGYRDLETNIVFTPARLNAVTTRLAGMADKQISVSNPLVDGTLPDGSRIQLTLGGDVANRGSNFTIRRFSDVPLTPVDLIRSGTFSVEQMAYLWLAVENGKSLLFAGGTGSGKTTSMNAVSFFIPPDAKVVSIEDTLEVTLPHENWIQSTTRESASATGEGAVEMYDLLQASLRQRPEYLLVGEVRTDPNVALTFFQAINTGHSAYTTFHSDSVDGALSRLANPPLSIPVQMLRELDIVSIQRQAFFDGSRVRRNRTITELGVGDDGTAVEPRTVFERNAVTDAAEQVGESRALEEVANERGWSEERLASELDHRERILRYLLDSDLADYTDVAATIQMHARDPEYVRSKVAADSLSPTDLPVDL